MTEELVGRVAVVTGSGRGFGREIALGLAEAGAAVVVTSRTKSQIDETVAAITDAGGRAIGVPADVTKLTDVQEIRRVAEDQFGSVSVVVHNAGVPWPFGPTWYVDPARWWNAQGVHVLGAMHAVNTFVPTMVERHQGHVIIVSSRGGTRVSANMSGYGVAKATQIRLAEFLAAEGAEHGVYAFSIHPGNEITDLSDLTIGDPDAQRYVGWFVEALSTRRDSGTEDPTEGFEKCRRLCVNLASGRYDELTGLYLDPDEDLDARLELLRRP